MSALRTAFSLVALVVDGLLARDEGFGDARKIEVRTEKRHVLETLLGQRDRLIGDVGDPAVAAPLASGVGA
ncbi:hypothetical protein EF294_18570 [Gordonia oryzae]|uniref:Uncharacterized protein n=1 Tax=Gordonia oryzae TaxID=2487349 RepID=A0A3N4GG00_9ACTN|nr:hypothetical protein EF294_18570 [Gordonia oryzae]